jgi:hypothetical protein
VRSISWPYQVAEEALMRGERSKARTLSRQGFLKAGGAGLAPRIAAKITVHTYAFLVDRMLHCPQGRIKELWA